MPLSRAEMKKFSSRTFETVHDVRLQSLTEIELADLRSCWGNRYNEAKKKSGEDDIAIDLRMRRELVAACIVDERGDVIFDWRSSDDLTELAHWNSGIFSAIHDACQRLAGLDRTAKVDTLEKKSEATTDS